MFSPDRFNCSALLDSQARFSVSPEIRDACLPFRTEMTSPGPKGRLRTLSTHSGYATTEPMTSDDSGEEGDDWEIGSATKDNDIFYSDSDKEDYKTPPDSPIPARQPAPHSPKGKKPISPPHLVYNYTKTPRVSVVPPGAAAAKVAKKHLSKSSLFLGPRAPAL